MFVAIKEASYPKEYAVGGITTAGSLGILMLYAVSARFILKL